MVLKLSAVLLDFVQISSPPPPSKKFDLSDIQNDLFSKILIKERQNICLVGHVYNLKQQFKVQIIGILEELNSLY